MLCVKFLPVLCAAVFLCGCKQDAPPEASKPAKEEQRQEEKESGPKPSILFCQPSQGNYGYADVEYLRELHKQGFAVDVTTSFAEITPERLKNYNVVVVYTGPESVLASPSKAMSTGDFETMLNSYLESGGGVMVITPEHNVKMQEMGTTLLEKWGVRIPLQRIRETDAKKIATFNNMAYEAAWTDQISPSPVSEGVKQIWYPVNFAYLAQMTMPIEAGPPWQVVARASTSAVTEAVKVAGTGYDAPKVPASPDGVKSPPLFAIRPYGKGRLAFLSQWPNFTVGSGTAWFFDRQILSRGFNGIPSDMGRLLSNTFEWLGEPSLEAKSPGGYVQNASVLLEKNLRLDAFTSQYAEPLNNTLATGPDPSKPPSNPTFRGLIGARTTYSSGKNSIAEYAQAARAKGLDFVIFTEEFSSLTPESFARLQAECASLSDATLKLFAGFTIEDNVGSRYFCFGPRLTLPPENILTGPGNKQLARQTFVAGAGGGVLTWMINVGHQGANFGYYDVAASVGRGAGSVPDMRTSSMVALRTYRDGALVDDVTADYFEAAAGCFPPTPVSFNEVKSVEELNREVDAGHALTYAQCPNLGLLYEQALRWMSPLDGPNVYPSDGPRILAWPACVKSFSFAGSEFVTGRMYWPSLLSIHADAGLKEARIYDGDRLYRRFLFQGEKDWSRVLRLDSVNQKNLVLVVEDMKGGKAVSYARRCWKEDLEAIAFCSDHVNDCKTPLRGPILSAHGPFQTPFLFPPSVPNPGRTWDGGPQASRPLLMPNSTTPVLATDRGTEEVARFSQICLLDFAGENGWGLTYNRPAKYDPSVPASAINPWAAYGPIVSTELMDFSAWYRSWNTPGTGPEPDGFAAIPVREGIKPTLMGGQIRFKQDLTLKSLLLVQFGKLFAAKNVTLFVGNADGVETHDLSTFTGRQRFSIKTGDWFGVLGAEASNPQIIVNRGAPVILDIGNPDTKVSWAFLWGDVENAVVASGDKLVYEFLALSLPIVPAPKDGAEFLKIAEYYLKPTGIEARRGSLTFDRGLVEIQAQDFAADFSIKRPAGLPKLTLPARIFGMNPRWSAGLWQKTGYVTGYYGPGEDRYSPLSIDRAGGLYLPLHPTWAERSELEAGHPVIADEAGRELFIQVTHVNREPHVWHCSVNNPTDAAITTTLTKNMNLPGFDFPTRTVTLKPGEYLELQP